MIEQITNFIGIIIGAAITLVGIFLNNQHNIRLKITEQKIEIYKKIFKKIIHIKKDISEMTGNIAKDIIKIPKNERKLSKKNWDQINKNYKENYMQLYYDIYEYSFLVDSNVIKELNNFYKCLAEFFTDPFKELKTGKLDKSAEEILCLLSKEIGIKKNDIQIINPNKLINYLAAS